ncbi:MAG: hypothetical protein D6730_02350, partial [Bacteroidetes bacterium]
METKDFLQQTFEHYEATPPRDVWPEIEAQLAAKAHRRKKWWPYLAVAASIGIIFGMLWTLRYAPRLERQLMAQQPIESGQPAVSPAAEELAGVAKANSHQATARPTEQALSVKEMQSVHTAVLPQPEVSQPAPSPAIVAGVTAQPPLALKPLEVSMGQPTVRLNSRPPKVPVHTVALLPETQPSAIRPVNKTTHTAKLDMSSLSLENALAFAAAEINKVVSTPIDI